IQQDVPHIQQEPFHAVKVSVILETIQQPLSTPPAPLLQATEIPSTQVPNSEVVNSVIQRFTKLEQAVKELKQADHSTAILASIRSQVPLVVEDYLGSSLLDALKKVLQSYTEELKKEVSKKRDYNDDALEKTPLPFAQYSSPDQSTIQVAESVSKYELKKILYAKMHKSQSHLTHDTHQELYDALTWSVLLDEATTKEGDNIDKVLKKRDQPNLDNVADDADEPQADAHPKILKKVMCSRNSQTHDTYPTGIQVKTLDDVYARISAWYQVR
ncbi:hypothetical protein Tco_0866905, partial [Tanacetum coccineum]